MLPDGRVEFDSPDYRFLRRIDPLMYVLEIIWTYYGKW